MITSLRYILAIAAAERTMLYRTAKFWVLAGIGVLVVLLFIVGTTIAAIVADSPPGEFLLEGTDAFLALYFFGYMQAVLIIFVAGDFRKAEEKAGLDQVMLCRPMTTANWVLGKYLGIAGGLVYLNLGLIVLAAIGRLFKVIFTGAAFNLLPALQYFAIAPLPAILFMTALVFFLVSLLRVQALAVILPLGYVAALWFYFHHDFYGMFDYAAFFAPLFASDLIGFGDIENILWQRSFFVSLALALVSMSILLYPRLRQSLWSHRLVQISALVFLGVSTFVGGRIITVQRQEQRMRIEDIAYQKQWISQPRCQVTHYDMDVVFGEDPAPLQVASKLIVANPNPQPLQQLVFSLNGTLKVSGAHWQDGTAIRFEQEHQLLRLDLGDRSLPAGAVDSLALKYAGGVDADGFMLDRLPETKGIISKRDGPWIKGEISAWLRRDLAVLPSQCGWYPIPGVIAGHPYASPRPQNFCHG